VIFRRPKARYFKAENNPKDPSNRPGGDAKQASWDTFLSVNKDKTYLRDAA